MQKELILIRHGEAESIQANDHARKLTQQGASDVKSTTDRLKSMDHRNSLLLSSNAQRTVETTQIISKALGVKHVLRAELYLASSTEIRHEIEKMSNDVVTLIVVGHNPGLSMLAAELGSINTFMRTAEGIHFKFEINNWLEIAGAFCTDPKSI